MAEEKDTTTPETTEVKDDDFDAGFEEALAAFSLDDDAGDPDKLEPGDPAAKKDAADAEFDEKPADEKPAEEKPAEEKPAEEKPAEEKPAEEKPVEKPAEKPAEKPVEKPAEKPAEEKPAEEEPEYKLPEFVLSEEDKEYLSKFEEQWPDMPKAVQLYLAKTQHEMQNKMVVGMANLLGMIEDRIKPLQTSYDATTYNAHMTALKSANPDYDQIVDKVGEWIKAQPEYLQKTYQAVYDGGTVEETNDLFARYRKETGTKAPEPSEQRPDAAAQAAAAAQKAKAAARAEALAPVKAERTNPAVKSAKGDPNDFDSAFEEALSLKD